MPPSTSRLAGVLLAAILSCSPSGSADSTADAMGTSELSPTLTVRVESDTVRLVLQVTNAGPDAVRLEFPSAQRFDFGVLDESGETLWWWSADRGFAQMLGTEELAAGATLAWDAVWARGDRGGRFEAVGLVTSSSHPIELRTLFELPAR